MNISKKQISDTQVELAIKLDRADILPYLQHAASHISQHKNIPGFRPGKAPYDTVKKHVGEDVIFKEALDDMVNLSLIQAIRQENLKVFDESDFKTEKMGPEEIAFSIKLTLLPEISLGDWTANKLKKSEVSVTDDEANKAAEDLAKMLVREQAVDRESKLGDSTVIDFDVLVDDKIIDKGSGRNFSVILGENKMIPGFEEALAGRKTGEEFSFKQTFPNDYAEHLAGKEAEFRIKVHQILERIVPAIDDELAKKLGEQSKDTMISRLKENLLSEKREKEQDRIEIEAVKQTVTSAKIGPLPEKAVDSELDKILSEFEHDLSHQGNLTFESYLKSSGKTKEQVRNEFRPKAIERVKTSLVVSKIIDDNKLEVTDEEVDRELAHQKEYFRSNDKALADINHPTYRDHLKNRMFNRKAIKFIASKIVE